MCHPDVYFPGTRCQESLLKNTFTFEQCDETPPDGFNPVESLGPSVPLLPLFAFQGNFIILKFNLEKCDWIENNLGDL